MNKEYFGKKFYEDRSTGYWISTSCPKIRAHRWVWKNVHGEIPKGYHIHHKDENKGNNDISNLELVSPKEHAKKHWSKERSDQSRKNILKLIEKAKGWHSSEEGKAWHRLHAIKCGFGKYEKKPAFCKECNKIFLKKSNQMIVELFIMKM